jgi:MoxR-like ATPase
MSPEIVINRVLQTVALPAVNAVPQQGHSVPPVMQTVAASGR